MALGAVEVSPIDMATAYAAFANGGRRVEAYGISRIRTPQGRVIYQRAARDAAGGQAINNPPLYYMNQMLRGVVERGTAQAVAIPGRDLAGKTGTTSDYKDAWFVGYTGGFVTAVWVGKDDNTAMRGVTGGSAPAAIWKGFMEAALPRLNAPSIPDGPPMPEGWVAPDPVGDLMNSIEDPFGDSRVIDGVDMDAGQPYDPSAPANDNPRQAEAMEPRRREEPPAQNPEPAQPRERERDPLFF